SLPQVERLADLLNSDQLEISGRLLLRTFFGKNNSFETQATGLLQANRLTSHRTDLAAQSHFAQHQGPLAQGLFLKTRDDGKQYPQVDRRLIDIKSADHVEKDVLSPQMQANDLFKNRAKQGYALRINSDRYPPRHSKGAWSHQGL